jgi:hypothetical protein
MQGALDCQLRAGRLARSASGGTGHANSEMRRVSVQGPQLFAGWRARLRHHHTLQHQRLAPLAYSAPGAAMWHAHAACTRRFGYKTLCADVPW